MPPIEDPRIVEQDGDIVRIVAGSVEVLAEMTRLQNEIVLSRVSVDGAGPGTVGLVCLREMARHFARTQGVQRIRVRGTPRTTGANPGKIPRDVIIHV